MTKNEYEEIKKAIEPMAKIIAVMDYNINGIAQVTNDYNIDERRLEMYIRDMTDNIVLMRKRISSLSTIVDNQFNKN